MNRLKIKYLSTGKTSKNPRNSTYSWLVIFDGPSADPEKIISQNCGNIAPDDIRSTSNAMTIR